MGPSAGEFDKISLTAKFVAYWRQYSDIPFAADVAERVHATEEIEGFLAEHRIAPRDIGWYGALFELRYKSILAYLQRSGVDQIIELASGLAFRGLHMARDPAIAYVETDLPAITRERVPLAAALATQYGLEDHGNYRLVPANALDPGELLDAVRHFHPDRPVAVVHEGLLPYLARDEITAVARGVGAVLGRFGGVWVTPDFSLRDAAREAVAARVRIQEAIKQLTGRQLHASAFEDEAQLNDYAAGLGFRAASLPQVELVPRLSSPVVLGIPDRALDGMTARCKLWVLTPAK